MSKNHLLLFIIASMLTTITCQSKEEKHEVDKPQVTIEEEKTCIYIEDEELGRIYTSLDSLPKYQEGIKSLSSYIMSNYRITKNDSAQGTFRIKIVVAETGEVKRTEIFKTALRDYTIQEKAITDFLLDMPKWTPGYCKNKAVAAVIPFPLHISPQ